MNPFWIVINADGGPSTYPHRHYSESAAIQEANRLCREHGGTFFVLEAQFCVQKKDIVTTRLSDNSDIPF